MAKLSKVIGLIYPLPESIIRSMFKKKKTIFVKFISRELKKKTKVRIMEGIKLYIYQSGGLKKVIGEAKISKVEYLCVNEIFPNYKSRLFLTETELKEYSKGREDKHLWVLHLKNLKRYEDLLRVCKPMTMAGLYITKDNKDKIFQKKSGNPSVFLPKP